LLGARNTWSIQGALANQIEDIIFLNQSGARTKWAYATFPALADGYLFFPRLPRSPAVTFFRAYQLVACVNSISDWFILSSSHSVITQLAS